MKLRILSTAAACIALVACNTTNNQNQETQINERTAPSITGTIAPAENYQSVANTQQATISEASLSTSRLLFDGTKTTFTNDDQIALYGVEWQGSTKNDQKAGTMVSSGNIIDNHPYRLTSSGWESTELDNALTWRNISFFGYYPYNSAATDALAHPLTRKDGSYDYFIYGAAALNSQGYTPLVNPAPIALNFEHQMAELNVTVTLPSVYLENTVQSIDKAYIAGTPSEAKFNMSTGVMTTSTETESAEMKQTSIATNGRTATFTAVVPPKSYSKGDPMFEITYSTSDAGEKTLHLNAPTNGFQFDKAKRYNFNIEQPYEFMFVDNASHLKNYLPKAGGTFTVSVSSTDPSLYWGLEVSNGCDWVQVPAGYDSVQGSRQNISITYSNNATGSVRITALKLVNKAVGSTQVIEVPVIQEK